MSFIGGLVGAGSQIEGGQMQQDAASQAQQMQWKMYNSMRSDLSPYMTGGAQAFGNLSNLMGMGGPGASANMLAGLRNYPGYQFALQQGQQGIDRSMAARGLGMSGGEIKDSANYNQGMADQNFNNYFNQLMGMSGMGESAAAGVGNAGMGAATQAGSENMWGAQQMAGGLTGAANSLFGMNGSMSGMNWGDAFAFMSDRRAKDDIVKIGKLKSGLPVYHFRYKGSDLPQIGVMADEAKRVAPRAVRRAPDGFDRVDYGRIARLPARVVSDLPAFRRAA